MTEVNDVADRLQAEAAGTDERSAAPEGAPSIREFHRLPRLVRADLADELAELIPAVNKANDSAERISKLADELAEGEQPTDDMQADGLKTTASLYRLLGRIEKVLQQVADDQIAMTTWTESASDNDLMQLFTHFAGGISLGEASGSPN